MRARERNPDGKPLTSRSDLGDRGINNSKTDDNVLDIGLLCKVRHKIPKCLSLRVRPKLIPNTPTAASYSSAYFSSGNSFSQYGNVGKLWKSRIKCICEILNKASS